MGPRLNGSNQWVNIIIQSLHELKMSSLQWSSRWSQSCREAKPWAPAAPEERVYRSWSTEAWKQAKEKKCEEQRRRAWTSFRSVSGGPEVCDWSRYWGHVGWEILQWGEEGKSANSETSGLTKTEEKHLTCHQSAVRVFRMALTCVFFS